MPVTFRNRTVPANQVIYDQVDLFLVDQYTRVTGVQITDVTFIALLNNAAVSWPLANGASVTDQQVVAGAIYWAVLPNGGYGVRFFPNQLGRWHLTFTYPGTPQIVELAFDVVIPANIESGLTAGFCA